jgi:hypothetical protein
MKIKNTIFIFFLILFKISLIFTNKLKNSNQKLKIQQKKLFNSENINLWSIFLIFDDQKQSNNFNIYLYKVESLKNYSNFLQILKNRFLKDLNLIFIKNEKEKRINLIINLKTKKKTENEKIVAVYKNKIKYNYLDYYKNLIKN